MSVRHLAELEGWGWTPALAKQVEELESSANSPVSGQALVPGRIILEQRGIRGVITADGSVDARIAGRLRHVSLSSQPGASDQQPAIGDWVLLRPPRADQKLAQIQHVLPRTSKISRKEAGNRTREQIVAANVDLLFVVMGLDGDFNPRRLQRFLITARTGGSEPVVVLNKADLTDRLEEQLAELEVICRGVPIVVTCCKSDLGLDELKAHMAPRQTMALVGSSGVGKSTLLNVLSGDELMATGNVRASDDRGQHTTSHRQLWRLPSGALMIDNPGIRELQPWDADDQLDETFDDVTALAADCRYRDCGHGAEPGCAVRRAIEQGELEQERLGAFQALQEEAARLNEKQHVLRQVEEKKQLRAVHRAARKFRPRTMD